MIEVGHKLLHIRIYGKHKDNYELSFFVFKDGERGIITGLLGEGFYKHVHEIFKKLNEHGITVVCGNVSKVHARLIRMYSKGFEITLEPTMCEGREMMWLTAKLKL